MWMQHFNDKEEHNHVQHVVYCTKLVNLKWNWSTKCVFWRQDEMIKQLFFVWKIARSIWSAIHMASNFYPQRSVANIFGNWLHGIDHMFWKNIRVGSVAIISSLWHYRNEKVSNDKKYSLLRVLNWCGSFFFCSRFTLQCVQYRELFYVGVCMAGLNWRKYALEAIIKLLFISSYHDKCLLFML